MSTIIQDIERRQLREVPRFKAGDTVRVHFRVIEGSRRRIQVFEGIVIKRQGAGALAGSPTSATPTPGSTTTATCTRC